VCGATTIDLHCLFRRLTPGKDLDPLKTATAQILLLARIAGDSSHQPDRPGISSGSNRIVNEPPPSHADGACRARTKPRRRSFLPDGVSLGVESIKLRPVTYRRLVCKADGILTFLEPKLKEPIQPLLTSCVKAIVDPKHKRCQANPQEYSGGWNSRYRRITRNKLPKIAPALCRDWIRPRRRCKNCRRNLTRASLVLCRRQPLDSAAILKSIEFNILF